MNEDSIKKSPAPEDSTRRVRMIAASGFLLLAGVVFSYGVATSFGFLKTMAILTTLSLAGTALVDQRFFWLPRFVVFLVVTCFMLLLVDVGLWAADYRIDARIGLRGLFTNDPTVGYRLSPNWQGIYDDGVVRGKHYRINSLGHRDAEPSESNVPRAFILGDSFAFGDLLDDNETIDRQVEDTTGGKIDAYNLGVPGYGVPATLHCFRNSALSGEAAIFLLYENDLRNDGFATQENTVRRGFLVQTKDKWGREIDVEELDQDIDAMLSPYLWIKEVVRLRHIRRSAFDVMNNTSRIDLDRERDQTGAGPFDYNIQNIQLGLEYTLELQALALERGMKFVVFVIPSTREVGEGRYHDRVSRYVAALEAEGVPVIDEFSKFEMSDYYDHDSHFNPKGAGKVAFRLVEWMREVNLY